MAAHVGQVDALLSLIDAARHLVRFPPLAVNRYFDPLVELEIDKLHAVALQHRHHAQVVHHLAGGPIRAARQFTHGDLRTGILEQFDGYFELKELDWEGYRDKYENIGRMDRILEAEGKSPDEYKVSKQADALMTFYNLDTGEVAKILDGAGYTIGEDMLHQNFDYYFQRTSHGSTLSRLVHSYLANLIGEKELSWQLYMDALKSDYADVQGGTTKEGIHTGVMAGAAALALKSYAGLNVNGEQVGIAPCLPAAWREVRFNIGFKGDRYYFVVTPESVEVKVDSACQETVDVFVRGRKMPLAPQKWEAGELRKGEA